MIPGRARGCRGVRVAVLASSHRVGGRRSLGGSPYARCTLLALGGLLLLRLLLRLLLLLWWPDRLRGGRRVGGVDDSFSLSLLSPALLPEDRLVWSRANPCCRQWTGRSLVVCAPALKALAFFPHTKFSTLTYTHARTRTHARRPTIKSGGNGVFSLPFCFSLYCAYVLGRERFLTGRTRIAVAPISLKLLI